MERVDGGKGVWEGRVERREEGGTEGGNVGRHGNDE